MPSTGGMTFFGLITTKENLIVYIRNVKKTKEDSFSCYINNGGGRGALFTSINLRPHFVALCWKGQKEFPIYIFYHRHDYLTLKIQILKIVRFVSTTTLCTTYLIISTGASPYPVQKVLQLT